MNSRVGFSVFSLAVSAVCAWGSAYAADAEAQRLLETIVREGAAKVVADARPVEGAKWGRILRGVETGSSDWLAVARALQPGADASAGETLSIAIAGALKSDATAVLRFAQSEQELEQTCGVPLIEPTDAEVKAWRNAALTSLAKVSDPALQPKAKACAALFANSP